MCVKYDAESSNKWKQAEFFIIYLFLICNTKNCFEFCNVSHYLRKHQLTLL